jgi:hypothetical protein
MLNNGSIRQSTRLAATSQTLGLLIVNGQAAEVLLA